MSIFLLAFTACNPKDTNTTATETPTIIAPSKAPTLESLKNNPDVTWIGETIVEYPIGYYADRMTKSVDQEVYSELGFRPRPYYKMLKYQVDDRNKASNDDLKLMTRILNRKENLTFYKTADLKETYSLAEVNKMIARIDTFNTFDPKTMQPTKMVSVVQVDPKDVRLFQVKQLIYYSQKDLMFHSIPVAAAPVECPVDAKTGKLSGEKNVLFWLKINTQLNQPDLNNANIKWAKRIYPNAPVDKIKVLKESESLETVIAGMLEGLKKASETVKLYSTFSPDGEDLWTPNEVKSLFSSTDTIITFDPKTFEQQMQVVESHLSPENMIGFRLVQDWYWNDQNQDLTARYIAFVPIIQRLDEAGNFLNSGPAFVKRVGE